VLAVKQRTPQNLRGTIPTFIQIGGGKKDEAIIRGQLHPESGASCIMSQGSLDFGRLLRFHDAC